jgi:quercetin dioxygenase-like cupin family protein
MKNIGFLDVPAERFERYDIVGHQINRHLAGDALTGTPGIDHITFPPGFIHKMHRHPYADQFMIPLTGQLRVESAGAEPREVKTGEIIVLPRNTWHEVLNLGSSDCACIHIFTGVDTIGEIGFEPYEGRKA